jgi:hypothetical protein
MEGINCVGSLGNKSVQSPVNQQQYTDFKRIVWKLAYLCLNLDSHSPNSCQLRLIGIVVAALCEKWFFAGLSAGRNLLSYDFGGSWGIVHQRS